MKITEQTIAILKNFASLNPSIQFRAGNVIKTKMPSNNLMASATIDERVPEDFAILDLPRFIGTLALFKDPTLEFTGDNAAKITDGRNSVRYSFSLPALIEKNVVSDYDRKFPLPKTIHEFDLSWEDLQKVIKAATVLAVGDITVVAKNGELSLVAQNTAVQSSDNYVLSLGDCDVEFSANFKLETLKFIPDNYHVTIRERLAASFTGEKVDYLVVSDVKL